MEIKQLEYALDNYFHHTALNAEIKHRNALIFEYGNQFDTLNGMQYTDMPHNPTPQDVVLNTICRIDEGAKHYQERIQKIQFRIDGMNAMDEQIEDALPLLDNGEYNVIAMRHGQSKIMSFTDIGHQLNYSERWAKDKYYNTLHKLISILEKSVQKPSKAV